MYSRSEERAAPSFPLIYIRDATDLTVRVIEVESEARWKTRGVIARSLSPTASQWLNPDPA